MFTSFESSSMKEQMKDIRLSSKMRCIDSHHICNLTDKHDNSMHHLHYGNPEWSSALFLHSTPYTFIYSLRVLEYVNRIRHSLVPQGGPVCMKGSLSLNVFLRRRFPGGVRHTRWNCISVRHFSKSGPKGVCPTPLLSTFRGMWSKMAHSAEQTPCASEHLRWCTS